MPLSRRRARLLLALLLFAGAALRLHGLRWDQGHHLHPDERFISMVEEKLAAPKSLAEYFDSSRNPLNPYNRGYGSFVYGTFPMLLAKGVGKLLGMTGYDGTYLVGRILSTLFDLFTVFLVYRITRRFAGRGTSLLAAGLIAFCVFAIQLAHFWTVDTYLTTFTAAVLLGSVRMAQGQTRWLEELGIGLCLGLATACKVTALALLLPIGVAVLIRMFTLPRARTLPLLPRLARAGGRLVLLLLGTALAIRLFLPTAFAGPSPVSFRLDPRWFNDLKTLSSLTRSVAGYPPNLQWAGRTILFPIRNFVLWGAGPFFGLAAMASLVWALFVTWRRRALSLLPVLLHALFIFLYHGTAMVKTMRYFYPAYPALAVLAALGLTVLARRGGAGLGRGVLRLLPHAVLAATFLWSLAFSAIYARPHTRVEASRWIYEHVRGPARVANETWDDGLPFPLPGRDNTLYGGPMLDLWGPDNREKVGQIVRALSESDWIAVTSGRVYRNITRLPSVFPMTTAYYRALFDGRLGFEAAADFTSYPSLGPLRIPDDAAEEQFVVYDHPRVVLFRKTAAFSADRAAKMLAAAMPKPPPALAEWEKWPRSHRTVTAPLEPPRLAEVRTRAEARLERGETTSLVAAAIWYLATLLVGLCTLPIAWALFPRLADRGAGLARILGLLLATCLLMIAVKNRVLENGRTAALAALGTVSAASVLLFLRHREGLVRFLREKRGHLLAGEAAFAAGFLLFLGLRALNPEIYWGEKPMDFSILNVLVRTKTLPASDPWFAGAPLGYYAFGHQTVAFLTLVTGLSTRFTFNLAFGLLGGLTLQAAFTLGRNWAGTLRAGAACATLVAILGNLSGLRQWLIDQPLRHEARHLDWHYFWATSRVVPDTINEYPFWSLVFADLHAHVFAIPLLLFFAACALHFVRLHAEPLAGLRSRLVSAVLLGFAAATQALTNAWDVPLLAGLLFLVPLCAAFAPGRLTSGSTARAGVGFATAVAAALLVTLPLWVRRGGGPGFGRNVGQAALSVDVLTIFGLFFFLAIAWWLAALSQRLGAGSLSPGPRRALLLVAALLLAGLAYFSIEIFCLAGVLLYLAAVFLFAEEPEDRLVFGFTATGFFLVLFAQRLFIYDRMNTFFKLFLEAWLLFSVALAVLVFRSEHRRGAIERWAWPARVLAAVLVAAALFTSVTGASGAVRNHFAAYSGPSLDGLRYLKQTRPGEYQAVMWLRRTITGTPVVLEAHGEPYQDFGRISMLTGLPTVLGWEHHVKQRGNPEQEVLARKEAVRQIYSHPEAGRIEDLLRRYHVGYVYVGWLERRAYPAAGLRKFRSAGDLFEVAYENPEVTIYRVVGGDSEDVLAPTREVVEPAAGTEAVEPEQPPEILDAPEPGRPAFGGMREPRDADVDARGRVWIADFGYSRLRIFDAEGGYLGGWGGRGEGQHGFRELCGVAIRGDDLYVADTWNGRVVRYSLAGDWKGSAAGLYGPRGVAIGSDGRVWATDSGNHRLVLFTADLTGSRHIGQRGSGRGEFSNPIGVAVAPSGEVFVADAGNRRVQVLGPTGGFHREIRVAGWSESVEPHLEVDEGGTLYVTDPAGNLLLVYDGAGRLAARLSQGDAGDAFSRPTGLALDRKGRILYVVNSGSNRVSRINLSGKTWQ